MNVNGMHLEAEVPSGSATTFETRYQKATSDNISPGSPPEYKEQDNKWGKELRIYFNDTSQKAALIKKGFNVETRKSGYLSGEYLYRVNSNDLWWDLVESHGAKLGTN